jgi:hypothetical protein
LLSSSVTLSAGRNNARQPSMRNAGDEGAESGQLLVVHDGRAHHLLLASDLRP